MKAKIKDKNMDVFDFAKESFSNDPANRFKRIADLPVGVEQEFKLLVPSVIYGYQFYSEAAKKWLRFPYRMRDMFQREAEMLVAAENALGKAKFEVKLQNIVCLYARNFIAEDESIDVLLQVSTRKPMKELTDMFRNISGTGVDPRMLTICIKKMSDKDSLITWKTEFGKPKKTPIIEDFKPVRLENFYADRDLWDISDTTLDLEDAIANRIAQIAQEQKAARGEA